MAISSTLSVIPGWCAAPDPESRDSGFDASHRPGMTTSMLRPENLPRFSRARNLAARASRAGGDRLDQLPVRSHLGAVGEIEGVLKPGAQVPAEFGAALVQRPDFAAPDRGDLPMRF